MNQDHLIVTYQAKHGKFKGQDVVTVCTAYDENKDIFVRGVSVCSPSETEPNESDGRFWARSHAERALKGRPDIPIAHPDAIRMLLKTDCPFVMQSELNPDLTFQEMAFFLGKKNFEKIGNYNREKNNPKNIKLTWTIYECGKLI